MDIKAYEERLVQEEAMLITLWNEERNRNGNTKEAARLAGKINGIWIARQYLKEYKRDGR